MVTAEAVEPSIYETMLTQIKSMYYVSIIGENAENLYTDFGCRRYNTIYLELDDNPKMVFYTIMKEIGSILKPTDRKFIPEKPTSLPYAYFYRNLTENGSEWDKVVVIGAKKLSDFREM